MIDPKVVGAFYAIFAIIATFANLGVIITILNDRKLRNNGIYISVIGLAIVDFVNGFYVMSISSYTRLNGTINDVGITMSTYYMFFIFMALIMYTLLLMYVNHIAYKNNPNEQRQKMVGIVGTLLTFIIITASIAVALHFIMSGYFGILTFLSGTPYIILIVCIYFLPLFFLCIGGLIIIMKHATNRLPSTFGNGMQDQIPPQRPQFPSHLVVAGFIAAFTAGPYLILSLIPVTCGSFSHCVWYSYMSVVLSFLLDSRSILLPFSWLLDPDYSAAFKTLFCCRNANQQRQILAPMTVYNNTAMAYGQQQAYQQQSQEKMFAPTTVYDNPTMVSGQQQQFAPKPPQSYEKSG